MKSLIITLAAVSLSSGLWNARVLADVSKPPQVDPPVQRKDDPAVMRAPVSESEFMQMAADSLRGDIKLAGVGASRAKEPRVKEFAEMLVKEHTATASELKSLAESAHVSLSDKPDPDTEKKFTTLTQIEHTHFDKAFLDEMAGGHTKDLLLFESGKKLAKTNAVIAFIDRTIPGLKDHVGAIGKLQTAIPAGVTTTPLEPGPGSEREFIKSAAFAGTGELKLARLGVTKAGDEQVKALAQTLVRDHAAAAQDLKSIAAGLDIPLPDMADPDLDRKHDMLNRKNGKAFDTAWLEEMATGHEKSIAMFESAKKTVKTPALLSFITNNLPILKNHTDAIRKVQLGTRPDVEPVTNRPDAPQPDSPNPFRP
jgi:putative membrane protein